MQRLVKYLYRVKIIKQYENNLSNPFKLIVKN